MKAIFIALGITFIVVFASDRFFDYHIPGLLVLGIYLLLYGLVALTRSSHDAEEFPDDAPPDRSSWPLSGPFRMLGNKVGALLYITIFWTTNTLSLINPFQLVQIVRQMIGNEKLKNHERKTGNNYSGYQARANYCLPFHGEWLVFNGGITPKTSHSWEVLGQRFALDFVQADENFQRHNVRAGQRAGNVCPR